MSFAGKVCVVTGASSGIGRRTAVDLASEGAVVCAAARREKLLAELVEDLDGGPSRHSYIACDVSLPDDVKRLGAHVRARHGRCDLLVNSAGFSRPGRFTDDDALTKLNDVMATNLFGIALVTKELLPLLIEAAPSSIVNVASLAGRLTLGGASAYSASKFALVGWSEALHFEVAPLGVHVALVEPGPVPTEGFPQRGLRRAGLMRHTLSSAADVSRAIRTAAARRKLQRVVPRSFYLLVLGRYLMPPLYALGQRFLVKDRARENMKEE